jgi:hypothetical protein
MKKLTFILLAGALSFNVAAQGFSDGSPGKRHKGSNSKPKKHRAKKKDKKKESTTFYQFRPNVTSLLCLNYSVTKPQEVHWDYLKLNEGTNVRVSNRKRREVMKTKEKL